MAESYKTSAAVLKALKVLEIIGDGSAPLTLEQILIALNNSTRMSYWNEPIPKGTVRDCIASLAVAGYVEPVGDCWKASLKLAKFWGRMQAGLKAERDRANAALQAIGAE
jgi:DNA-binding IclR family transcriptional regulator